MGKTGEVSRVEASAAWSDWQPLAAHPALSAEVLAEILDGGQAFRWHHETDGVWLGIWSDCIARLRLDSAGHVEWCAPAPLVGRVAAALPTYFNTDADHAALVGSLPWRSDAHLVRCLDEFPGLRILQQPFGETLLGFLCSATKQIAQIKQMLAFLAARHGAPLLPETSFLTFPSSRFHRLPTWLELAAIPESDLRACQLGFRALYIHQTAQFLAAQPRWLEETKPLPYLAAKARLLELPGVGDKIADCVLLFGAGKLEAFPVDTWILQALANRYGLTGWKPAQLAQFGRAHFGPLAGLAQQYLFACERRAAKAPLSRNS